MKLHATTTSAAALSALVFLSCSSAFAQSSASQVTAVGCSSVIIDPNTAGTVPPDPSCLQPQFPSEAAAKPRRVWYGWQTLATDGAALALALAAGDTDDRHSTPLALASLGTYALGGPIVHAANGSAGRMGLSLALRVGAPMLLGAGGYYVFSAGADSRSWAPAIAGVLGGMIGIAGAVAVDASVLARKEAPPAEAASLRITPSVAPTRGGATVGAVGTF